MAGQIFTSRATALQHSLHNNHDAPLPMCRDGWSLVQRSGRDIRNGDDHRRYKETAPGYSKPTFPMTHRRSIATTAKDFFGRYVRRGPGTPYPNMRLGHEFLIRHDSWPDLILANGHVYPRWIISPRSALPGAARALPQQRQWNVTDISAAAGPGITTPLRRGPGSGGPVE